MPLGLGIVHHTLHNNHISILNMSRQTDNGCFHVEAANVSLCCLELLPDIHIAHQSAPCAQWTNMDFPFILFGQNPGVFKEYFLDKSPSFVR